MNKPLLIALIACCLSLRASAQNPIFFSTPPSSGTLSGSLANTPTTVNLTTTGTAGWIAWGTTGGCPGQNQSSSPANPISNYTAVGSPSIAFINGYPVTFSWTGLSGDTNGCYWSSVSGAGVTFTAPAGTSSHTLIAYLECYGASFSMSATLSDGSATMSPITSTCPAGVNTPEIFTFVYRAASNSQTLTLTFTGTASAGDLIIQAAAIQ
jgi:hypothetical protein